jgi:hypothetical protein
MLHAVGRATDGPQPLRADRKTPAAPCARSALAQGAAVSPGPTRTLRAVGSAVWPLKHGREAGQKTSNPAPGHKNSELRKSSDPGNPSSGFQWKAPSNTL